MTHRKSWRSYKLDEVYSCVPALHCEKKAFKPVPSPSRKCRSFCCEFVLLVIFRERKAWAEVQECGRFEIASFLAWQLCMHAQVTQTTCEWCPAILTWRFTVVHKLRFRNGITQRKSFVRRHLTRGLESNEAGADRGDEGSRPATQCIHVCNVPCTGFGSSKHHGHASREIA